VLVCSVYGNRCPIFHFYLITVRDVLSYSRSFQFCWWEMTVGDVVILSLSLSHTRCACREFHESSVQDDNHSSSSVASQPLQSPPSTTGRKTRNSNGSRSGPSSRPGLRSAKTSKSDTEGETTTQFQFVELLLLLLLLQRVFPSSLLLLLSWIYYYKRQLPVDSLL